MVIRVAVATHRFTMVSGRQCNLKEISDCKVVADESVARLARVVVCRMTLVTRKMKWRQLKKRVIWLSERS